MATGCQRGEPKSERHNVISLQLAPSQGLIRHYSFDRAAVGEQKIWSVDETTCEGERKKSRQ